MSTGYNLVGFKRLDSVAPATRQSLRDCIGSKLFDSVFSECVNIKQTNLVIESFVDALVTVAESSLQRPNPVQATIKTMKKINPDLAKRVFNEDSDNTAPQPSARMFTVTYTDQDNHEHTVEQQAFSPRSIRKRLEDLGYEVRDVVLSATGESVIDETVSRAKFNRMAEGIRADIDHLTSQLTQQTTVFNKNLIEGTIGQKRKELVDTIERGQSCGYQWNESTGKFEPNKREAKKPTSSKISLSDVFKK